MVAYLIYVMIKVPSPINARLNILADQPYPTTMTTGRARSFIVLQKAKREEIPQISGGRLFHGVAVATEKVQVQSPIKW